MPYQNAIETSKKFKIKKGILLLVLTFNILATFADGFLNLEASGYHFAENDIFPLSEEYSKTARDLYYIFLRIGILLDVLFIYGVAMHSICLCTCNAALVTLSALVNTVFCLLIGFEYLYHALIDSAVAYVALSYMFDLRSIQKAEMEFDLKLAAVTTDCEESNCS